MDTFTGTDQEIYHSKQGRIEGVKVNPSLTRMKEWAMFESLDRTFFYICHDKFFMSTMVREPFKYYSADFVREELFLKKNF